MTDKELIADFLNGNEKAFDELVRTHEEWIKSLLLKIIRNPEDTKDLSQDVFVKIYFALPKFRFESEFKTWVYRIVINQTNNYFRKEKLLSWFRGESSDNIEIPETQFDYEQKMDIYKLASNLPKIQRNIVLLKAYQDLPFREIAKILSISENSAKVSFHKAKANLKRMHDENN